MLKIIDGVIQTQDRWSLTKEEYMDLIEAHKEARQIGFYDVMEIIENHLEDINYHQECSALNRGDYDLVVQMWDNV